MIRPLPTPYQLLKASGAAIGLALVVYVLVNLAAIWAGAGDDDPIAHLDNEQEVDTDG